MNGMLSNSKLPSLFVLTVRLYPETGFWISTSAPLRTAPEGSSTDPRIVQLFDCAGARMPQPRNIRMPARTTPACFVIGPIVWPFRGRAQRNLTADLNGAPSGLDQATSGRRPRSPVEHVAHVPGLALADHKLLPVAERQQPALAGDHAHFADLFHVHQGVAVDPAERTVRESLFNRL